GKAPFFVGGVTLVVNALGNARATSNAAEYVAWRKANGYYETYDADAVAHTYALAAQFKAIRAAHAFLYRYDADGYLTEVTDPFGVKTTHTYDLRDNLVSTKTERPAPAASAAASAASVAAPSPA